MTEVEDELKRIDDELNEIGKSSIDESQFLRLMQLLAKKVQLFEDDQSLKTFSETVKLLDLDEKNTMKLISLRNVTVHGMQGLDDTIRNNEDWIRQIVIPAIQKIEYSKPGFTTKLIHHLQNISADYGYQIRVGSKVKIGSTYYEIDVIFESEEIQAIGEIKEADTIGSKTTGIRQLEIYMTGLKHDYGILMHGNHNRVEEMDVLENHILLVGTLVDPKKIFEWLDTQASLKRRGLEYEIFDWSGKDFKLGKKLSLYWVELLERTVKGEHVNKEKSVVEYARNKLGVKFSPEAVQELYQIVEERQGLFYRMGFDGRESTWTSLPKSLALERLKNERSRIRNLTTEALVGRYSQREMKEKVTLVPTSSMEFEKQVLILRAYVVLSQMGNEPVHYKRVMRVTNLARTQVSGVNAFFAGLGFLEIIEKGTYLPVKEVVQFFSEEPGGEDFSALQPVLMNSLLYENIRNLILVHGRATEDELIEYLLKESGETTKSRAKRALDWLECTGLISITNGDVNLQN